MGGFGTQIPFWSMNWAAASAPAPDAYTVFLGHFNGTQGQKTFTDSSTFAHGLTGNDAAHISTTQSKFGGSSLKLDGSGGSINVTGTRDFLSMSDSADWFMGTASFTIDWWHYSGITTTQMIFGQYQNSTNWWGVFSCPAPNTSNQIFGVGALVAAAWNVNISATSSTVDTPTNTWNHYAVVRNATTGVAGDWYLFINGTQRTKTLNVGAYNGSIPNYTGPAYVGTLLGNFANDCNGYIEELRVSKGIARWTSDFTPPTSPY